MAKKYSAYRQQLAKEYQKEYNKFYQRFKYYKEHPASNIETSYFEIQANKVEFLIANRSIRGLQARDIMKKLRLVRDVNAKKTATIKGAKHLQEFLGEYKNLSNEDQNKVWELYSKFIEDGTIYEAVKYEAWERLVEMVQDNIDINEIQAALQKLSDQAYYEFVMSNMDEPIIF